MAKEDQGKKEREKRKGKGQNAKGLENTPQESVTRTAPPGSNYLGKRYDPNHQPKFPTKGKGQKGKHQEARHSMQKGKGWKKTHPKKTNPKKGKINK